MRRLFCILSLLSLVAGICFCGYIEQNTIEFWKGLLLVLLSLVGFGGFALLSNVIEEG